MRQLRWLRRRSATLPPSSLYMLLTLRFVTGLEPDKSYSYGKPTLNILGNWLCEVEQCWSLKRLFRYFFSCFYYLYIIAVTSSCISLQTYFIWQSTLFTSLQRFDFVLCFYLFFFQFYFIVSCVSDSYRDVTASLGNLSPVKSWQMTHIILLPGKISTCMSPERDVFCGLFLPA